MAQSRLGLAATYLERLAANDYVQDRLMEAVENARGAYARASGRSAAKAARDRRLHRRVGRALAATSDAVVAVKTGRRKPHRRRGPVVVAAVVGVAGAGVAAAGPLRRKLAGGDSAAEVQPSPDVQTTAPAGEPSAA